MKTSDTSVASWTRTATFEITSRCQLQQNFDHAHYAILYFFLTLLCETSSLWLWFFRCPKALLVFPRSRSHTLPLVFVKKLLAISHVFLKKWGGLLRYERHRHSFCCWPPSPRKSAQSLHLLETATRWDVWASPRSAWPRCWKLHSAISCDNVPQGSWRKLTIRTHSCSFVHL